MFVIVIFFLKKGGILRLLSINDNDNFVGYCRKILSFILPKARKAVGQREWGKVIIHAPTIQYFSRSYNSYKLLPIFYRLFTSQHECIIN